MHRSEIEACTASSGCDDCGRPHASWAGAGVVLCTFCALERKWPLREYATERASLAFWDVFAQLFPEAKTGDFPPDAHFAWEHASEAAADTWLAANVPQMGSHGFLVVSTGSTTISLYLATVSAKTCCQLDVKLEDARTPHDAAVWARAWFLEHKLATLSPLYEVTDKATGRTFKIDPTKEGQ